MTTNIHELFLDPGDLAALFTSCGIAVSSQSPLAGSPLPAPSVSARPVAEIAPGVDSGELNIALQALAAPALVIAGLRGIRRMEPWPFFICRRTGGPAVILAPEGGGFTRLRFPYSDEALVDWLAGPFRRFAAPEIPCPEIPALTSSGMAVLLAMADIFRDRYPDLDPDWNAAEPITFTSEEATAVIAAGADGREPSSLMSGFARLGGPQPETLSLETVESLLYVFSNEGYLDMDLSASTPLFTMNESFIGTALSLAWWDMSLSLESRLGGRIEPIRVIQGLAVWRFITGSDQRTIMKAVSGTEIEAEVRALVSPSAAPQVVASITGERPAPAPSPASRNVPLAATQPALAVSPAPPATIPTLSYCTKCGKPMKPGVKFCGSCGTLTAAKTNPQTCRNCGRPSRPDARFCIGCGAPA